eukprot:TRINITY_DN10171_c3_g1_i1.p1 TRINITY_DN10171_c3_g1~~TRINITY_DN10171_c3_g1_i1.p1  ORF type:complete len:393 (+),score=29.23 TRINITY_DN10171_c3_g1_i1:91-1179(+)
MSADCADNHLIPPASPVWTRRRPRRAASIPYGECGLSDPSCTGWSALYSRAEWERALGGLSVTDLHLVACELKQKPTCDRAYLTEHLSILLCAARRRCDIEPDVPGGARWMNTVAHTRPITTGDGRRQPALCSPTALLRVGATLRKLLATLLRELAGAATPQLLVRELVSLAERKQRRTPVSTDPYPDLWLHIAEYVPACTVLNMSRVSRSWRQGAEAVLFDRRSRCRASQKALESCRQMYAHLHSLRKNVRVAVPRFQLEADVYAHIWHLELEIVAHFAAIGSVALGVVRGTVGHDCSPFSEALRTQVRRAREAQRGCVYVYDALEPILSSPYCAFLPVSGLFVPVRSDCAAHFPQYHTVG